MDRLIDTSWAKKAIGLDTLKFFEKKCYDYMGGSLNATWTMAKITYQPKLFTLGIIRSKIK